MAGRHLRVQVTATVLRDEHGRPHAVATTERDLLSAPEGEPSRHDILFPFAELPMPVVIEDAEGRLLDLNNAAENFVGSGRESVGQPVAAVLRSEDQSEADTLLDRCRRGETIRRVPARRYHRDGNTRPVRLTLIRLTTPVGAVATILEDTETAGP